MIRTCLLVAAAIIAFGKSARAEDYAAWPLLTPDFESTGGGGVRILDYDPVVSGPMCRTDFRARLPDGATYANMAEFDAVPVNGGILCMNGRWRAKDGSAEGTTPFRVFIKDGVKRGK
jgi:hypothetical protein